MKRFYLVRDYNPELYTRFFVVFKELSRDPNHLLAKEAFECHQLLWSVLALLDHAKAHNPEAVGDYEKITEMAEYRSLRALEAFEAAWNLEQQQWDARFLARELEALKNRVYAERMRK